MCSLVSTLRVEAEFLNKLRKSVWKSMTSEDKCTEIGKVNMTKILYVKVM